MNKTEIPMKEVLEFVGEGYDFVNCHALWGTRHRIDCYVFDSSEIVTQKIISKSFFVEYNSGIVDKTIQPVMKL